MWSFVLMRRSLRGTVCRCHRAPRRTAFAVKLLSSLVYYVTIRTYNLSGKSCR